MVRPTYLDAQGSVAKVAGKYRNANLKIANEGETSFSCATSRKWIGNTTVNRSFPHLSMLVLSLLLITVGACKDKPPNTPQRDMEVDAQFLELYALASIRDERFPIAVKGADGEVWFRETEPGLDLSHCDLDSLHVMLDLCHIR